jgi:hypothetical protein
MRTYDTETIRDALDFISENIGDIDPAKWLADPANIALENEHGDIALFEYGLVRHKIYSGHYYFKSRGKQALQSARDFLDELFNSCYNISILIGLIPIKNKAARWITRRLGFTSYGIESIHDKEYELFILTKKEFNNG